MSAAAPRTEFTAGDWIGVIVCAGLSGWLLLFPVVVGPTFARMFVDFGAELPLLTRLCLTPFFTVALSLAPAALVGVGTARRDRFLVVLSFIAGALIAGVLWLGMYLPIFGLAGKIE